MSDQDLPPDLRTRKSPRLAGFDYKAEGSVYLVTVRARAGLVPFTDPGLARAVTEALLYQRRVGHVRLYAYVLMPDHLHAAVGVVDAGRSLVDVVRDFKTYTTRLAWRYGLSGELWQRSFHDHIVRRAEDLISTREYIQTNPRRKGLVGEGEDWPYQGTPDLIDS